MLTIFVAVAMRDVTVTIESNRAMGVGGVYGENSGHAGIIQKEMKNPSKSYLSEGFL